MHKDLKEAFKYVLFRVIANVKVDFSHLKVFSYRILDRGRKYEYVMDAGDYFKFVRIYGMDCILEDELLTPRTAKDLERILPNCNRGITEQDSNLRSKRQDRTIHRQKRMEGKKVERDNAKKSCG